MQLSGWGNYPVVEAEVRDVADVADIEAGLVNFHGIVYGKGRSYGDSALAGEVLRTERFDRILAFDAHTGRVRCQAGVTLAALLEIFVPRGWFLPVTPGTKFVTVGGAIASDVHGKNHHHHGCFSQYVVSLALLLPDGRIERCSPVENAELFHAVCGGMGLLGVILDAELQLKPIASAFIEEKTLKAGNLAEVMELFDQHAAATYSVAWIDCLRTGKHLGRSLLMLGEHSEDGGLSLPGKTPVTVPVNLPGLALNRFSIAAFNALYYQRVRARETVRRVHYEPFFYPLDRILHWNRMYGRKGFAQYQFVIPREAGARGMHEILRFIADSKRGSFLAVLKLLGAQNANWLSFPFEGYTLALDFKMDAGLLEFLDRLDRLVLYYGGRIYLAKDARMSEATFRRGYPRWERFVELRRRLGADRVFNSLQSQRLGI
ncbi:MAG: FAD-binding oxidoreductase [Pseudomonadota bacterium]